MKALIDVSSTLWTYLMSGTDKEHGRDVEHEGKKVTVRSWQHGLDGSINFITGVMRELDLVPKDLIFVVEGEYSKSRRKAIYSGYKEGRESRPPEAYVEFGRCKEELTQAFLNVGSQVVTQAGVEGDDLLAYLVRNIGGPIVILTNDGDMTTLIDERVSLYQQGRLTTDNRYGPFPCRFVPVYKALVGDGKEYKGAVGFGNKAFLDLLVVFGDEGLAAIEGMMKRRTLHELVENVAELKALQKVVDGAKHVYESYQCALLHDEWCNTLRRPLVWRAGVARGRGVVTDPRLQAWAQTVTLATSKTYDAIKARYKAQLAQTEIVALDIETSTPEESDDWLRAGNREAKVDVFGSELTGCGLTFGRNNNHTVYFPVDHAETDNVTSAQVRELVEMIPQTTPIVVQNFGGFEAPILYAEWGAAMKDNGYHGFLPNVIDTAILASHVNENISGGLKQGSKHYLGYDQTSYDEVTKKTCRLEDWNGRGQVIRRRLIGEGGTVISDLADYPMDEVEYTEVDVEYKMRDLTGQEVLNYGADDTICCAALFNHFKLIMEIEKTWDQAMVIEQLPAYVTALSFHQGAKFDMGRMIEMAKEDQATYDKMWAEVRQFLVDNGWEGTVTPSYKELTPAAVKEAVGIILGVELNTRVRKLDKMAAVVADIDHEDSFLLGSYINENNLAQINDWVASRFTGEPHFDTNSPKQMREFLYSLLDLPIHLVNSTTSLERQNKPLLARLVSDHKKRWAGHETLPVPNDLYHSYATAAGLPVPSDKTVISKQLLVTKAKTDEKAMGFALLLDCDERPEAARVLGCIQRMKKCATRKQLYYTPYANLRHWKDNKIHGQAGQSRTTTRRYAPNDPNLGQLPKKGEGVKFRECFLPHHKDAVIVSIDFSGQELRQGAAQSGDKNMLACFIGDHKKDMHSLTAAGAMEKKWGKTKVAELVERFGQEDDDEYTLFVRMLKGADADVAKMCDDLRKSAKNVNFGAQYGAMAAKLAETLIIPVADAAAFLDAKFAMFPGFEAWKKGVERDTEALGYVLSPMGARRHLRDSILSKEWGVADRALRQGPSFKIQGGSAEQTKLAIARLWSSGILFTLDMVFFAPVHDELVWSVAGCDALESIKVVHAAMTAPYAGLEVPFLGSIAVGPNFGKLIECGDWIIEENILAAVAKSLRKEEVTA